MNRPRLSVVICVYNMAREAPRTLLSALPPYQQGVDADDYEIIVVDNGSTRPCDPDWIAALPPQVRWFDYPDPRPSPVFALNWAARQARGQALMMCIDGARIFSDRLVERSLAALDAAPSALVYTLGWHLGRKLQTVSILEGYDQQAEDRLLAEAGWPEDRSALFGISVLAGSSRKGFFQPISESNAFTLSRELWDDVGGYDERFTSPGAGLANLELFERLVTRPGAINVCLLGEGTFHQVHGGQATSSISPFEALAAEYQAVIGRPYAPPAYAMSHLGPERPEAARFVEMSRRKAEAAARG